MEYREQHFVAHDGQSVIRQVKITGEDRTRGHVFHLTTAQTGRIELDISGSLAHGERHHVMFIVRGAGEVVIRRSFRLVSDDASLVLRVAAELEGGRLSCSDDIMVDARCRLDLAMRGVLLGDALVEGESRVRVGAHAVRGYVRTDFDFLALGPKCAVKVLPALDVAVDDIECSHRVSVVQPSPEERFYCASRGVAETDGDALYAAAFLCPMFEGRSCVC